MMDDNDIECGIAPIETGNWDPLRDIACRPHDVQFDLHEQGLPNKGLVRTQAEFGRNAGIAWLKAAYTLVAAPVYVALAWTIGTARWVQLGMRKK